MAETETGAAEAPRLKRHYQDVVVPKLTEEFGYRNSMMVPRVDKIVLNIGVGEATGDSKKVQAAAGDLSLIAGQKAQVTKARKSSGCRSTVPVAWTPPRCEPRSPPTPPPWPWSP